MASTLRFDNWEDSSGDPIANSVEIARSVQTRPAFSVQVSNGVSTAVNNKILFSGIDSNVGNGWSSTNNNFIAPVAGVYYFSLSILNSAAAAFRVNIRKNGSSVMEAYAQEQFEACVGMIIIPLAINDVIDAYVSTGTAHGYHGFFSGFMIQ